MVVYLVDKWEGKPSETGEMAPKWFKKNNLPYGQMWESDIHWLPKVLNGEKLTAKFSYNDNARLLDFKVTTQSEPVK